MPIGEQDTHYLDELRRLSDAGRVTPPPITTELPQQAERPQVVVKKGTKGINRRLGGWVAGKPWEDKVKNVEVPGSLPPGIEERSTYWEGEVVSAPEGPNGEFVDYNVVVEKSVLTKTVELYDQPVSQEYKRTSVKITVGGKEFNRLSPEEQGQYLTERIKVYYWPNSYIEEVLEPGETRRPRKFYIELTPESKIEGKTVTLVAQGDIPEGKYVIKNYQSETGGTIFEGEVLLEFKIGPKETAKVGNPELKASSRPLPPNLSRGKGGRVSYGPVSNT